MTIRSRGFTLVELLVVIAILAILIALLVPLSASLVSRAHKAQCLSNLRQIGEACKIRASDKDGRWMGGNATIARGYGIDSTHARRSFPMGLAFLVTDGYLSDGDARIFYCPAWKHPYGQYDKLDVDGLDIVGRPNQYGGWPAAGKPGPTAHRIISYHYRSSFGNQANEPPSTYMRNPAATAIVADHFTRREVLYGPEYGHGKEYNALYMDGHAETTRDGVGYMNQVNTHYSHGNWALQEQIWRAFFDR